MMIFFSILIAIIAFLGILLMMAFLMKKNHFVIREIIIHAPQQKVFNYLKLLKNQDKFNKWAQADQERSWEYKGIDGTIGFIIAWNGNRKVGQGEKEIMNIVDGKKIETQIRFIRPMKTVADIVMELEFVTENQTKVYLSNAGVLNYPMNIMIPLAEKMFPKDMDESLRNLKNILEQ